MNSPATHAISINPTNGEVISSLPWATTAEVDITLTLADTGFRLWRKTPVAQRADALRAIGRVLRERGEEMAQCITREMGKPINQA
ncbi:MAG: aldehyde dehydrogenase family protein, partial [Kluyvera sp.]